MKTHRSHSIVSFFIITMNIIVMSAVALKQVHAEENKQNLTFAFLPNYETTEWHHLPDGPFDVNFFTGDTETGIIVFGGFENKQGAYLRHLSQPKWELLATAPFDVKGCSGNNSYGPIIFGGQGNTQVAYMRKYTENRWELLAEAPFSVTTIAGNNLNGIVAVGGKDNRKVPYMRRYSENKWKSVSDAPFSVIDVGGTAQYGPVLVGGQNNRQVAYMKRYSENKWRLLPVTPMAVTEIVKADTTGLLVCSSKRVSGGIQGRVWNKGGVNKKALKAAVVEFSEKGDLGIQDAGSIVTDWMVTSLNKTGVFEVYERLSLDVLMEEHKLQMTGIMDEESFAEIGRVRGVEAIITGSIIKFANIISVTAKVIDVETAKIIDSADIKTQSIGNVPDELDKLAMELALDNN